MQQGSRKAGNELDTRLIHRLEQLFVPALAGTDRLLRHIHDEADALGREPGEEKRQQLEIPVLHLMVGSAGEFRTKAAHQIMVVDIQRLFKGGDEVLIVAQRTERRAELGDDILFHRLPLQAFTKVQGFVRPGEIGIRQFLHQADLVLDHGRQDGSGSASPEATACPG